jgi:hypothetical protein
MLGERAIESREGGDGARRGSDGARVDALEIGGGALGCVAEEGASSHVVESWTEFKMGLSLDIVAVKQSISDHHSNVSDIIATSSRHYSSNYSFEITIDV